MIHGGKGYAVLPEPENSSSCEQQIEVISPSGQVCGSATFSIGGGACTTGTIIVGYDGTVVQRGPARPASWCDSARRLAPRERAGGRRRLRTGRRCWERSRGCGRSRHG